MRLVDVAAGGDLPQQLGEKIAEAFPELRREIGPPELSKAVEVELCCPSSGHGVEPPRSKESHRLRFSEKR
jgi:hypothetical protein